MFFFDEAHLLFDDAPDALVEKIEQVVRLIRSKGVGVYFVTQNPLDVPDTVLAQLGNRVQHALRAFTPRDQKAVKTAAETLRANPALDTETGDHRTRRRRSARLLSRREGHAHHRRARLDSAAGVAHWRRFRLQMSVRRCIDRLGRSWSLRDRRSIASRPTKRSRRAHGARRLRIRRRADAVLPVPSTRRRRRRSHGGSARADRSLT